MYKPKELSVYCCTACFEVQVKTSTPKIKGCKKTSFHNWLVLGEKGLNKYVCQACGVKVNTVDPPVESGCVEGKKHQWNKV
jgi:hypothetical protein